MAVRGSLGRASFSVVLALSLGGCAVFESENRRTLNALDEHVTPQGAGARWALSPLALPLGFGALAADLLLVHPVCSVDDAWGDTVEWLWTPRGETRFRRAVMLPLVTVATPVVFGGDLAGRSVFPIDPRKDASP
jgi:hypothetical protein